MIAWRICKRRFLDGAFSGLGAEKAGGRWNEKGDKVVYASENLSLACLELFVYLEPGDMPDDLFSISARIPDTISREEINRRKLPRNWRHYPAPPELQTIGSTWIREKRSLILLVPSTVNPEENNILINPDHPQMPRIKIRKPKPFRFDPRMWDKS